MSLRFRAIKTMKDRSSFGIQDLMDELSITHVQGRSVVNKLVFLGLLTHVRKGQGHYTALYKVTPAGMRYAPDQIVPVEKAAIMSRSALQSVWGSMHA